MCVCKPQVDGGNPSPSSPLIHPGCISQSDPELLDMARLTSQLLLGILSLLLEVGVTGGPVHSPRIYMDFWGS